MDNDQPTTTPFERDDPWDDIGPNRPNRVALYRKARRVQQLATEAATEAQNNNIGRAMAKLAEAEAAAQSNS